MDRVLGIAVLWVLPVLVMLLVSAWYFRASTNSASVASRLAVSAHGIVGVVLLLGALALNVAGVAEPRFRTPYLILWIVPLALIALALWRFAGRSRVHVLQLLNVAAMAWAVIVGYTAVGGGK